VPSKATASGAVASPQNPHNPRFRGIHSTENPRTKRGNPPARSGTRMRGSRGWRRARGYVGRFRLHSVPGTATASPAGGRTSRIPGLCLRSRPSPGWHSAPAGAARRQEAGTSVSASVVASQTSAGFSCPVLRSTSRAPAARGRPGVPGADGDD
jgi:hypothetical protein